ncbi:MAG: hypothetical protein KDD56_10815, partial [Bdellovibrionales bacterium]|nr:hypothetical protein [Bdellovibrionales bacterium]
NSQISFNCQDAVLDEFVISYVKLAERNKPNLKIMTRESFFKEDIQQLVDFSDKQKFSFSENCSSFEVAHFQANTSFKPSNLGLSEDNRDLSFQLRFQSVPAYRFKGLVKQLFFNRNNFS